MGFREARLRWVFLALSALVLTPLAATVALKLKNGKVLEGDSVEREGELYVLIIRDGARIPLPPDLVESVSLAEAKEEAPPRRREEPFAEERPSRPRREAPTGWRTAEPEVLAGERIEAPTTEEQLAVFGEPARFQQDVVKSNLRPSYWVMDPSQHNPNPARWAKAPVDSNWEPESAFDANKDVMAGSRSSFSKSIVDSSWQPTDGFAKKKR